MGSKEIAERIKRLREHYHLSQEDLAGVAHVTKAAVSLWELGKTENLKTGAIKNICQTFPELNPAWFLGGDSPMFLQRREELDLVATISNKLETLDEASLRKVLRFIEDFL